MTKKYPELLDLPLDYQMDWEILEYLRTNKSYENSRNAQWYTNKIIFELKLEELLSHCPNMVDEGGMMDLCEKHKCQMYIYCVGVVPAEIVTV